MKRTVLKRGTKPLKCSRPNPVSKKQEIKNAEWRALGRYLVEHRAKDKCEIPRCVGNYNLQAHHILFRRYNIHNAGNCLIACGKCHSHHEWGPGIPIPAEQALLLVAELNSKAGIDPNMTGADVLNKEE